MLYTIHKRTADAVRAALRVEGTSLEEGAEVVLFAHREPRAAGSVLALMYRVSHTISIGGLHESQCIGFSSQGRARLRAFLCCFTVENTQLRPSLTCKACNKLSIL